MKCWLSTLPCPPPTETTEVSSNIAVLLPTLPPTAAHISALEMGSATAADSKLELSSTCALPKPLVEPEADPLDDDDELGAAELDGDAVAPDVPVDGELVGAELPLDG